MTSLILLAGGKGTRLGLPTPKQYLPLNGKPIALHSFDIFLSSSVIEEIIVVCEPQYQYLFSTAENKPVLFALPGTKRQDSVYSGLLQTSPQSSVVLCHDSARPFIELKYLLPLLAAVKRTGAAALGSAVASTIKKCNQNCFVEKTLDRSVLWEAQTPQGLKRALFFEAFDFIHREKIEVTDELSMVEVMGLPSEIVPSSSKNFKITTPSDLELAQKVCATN